MPFGGYRGEHDHGVKKKNATNPLITLLFLSKENPNILVGKNPSLLATSVQNFHNACWQLLNMNPS